MEDQVRLVLRAYPSWLVGGPLESLGNHGGFSGARLWRWRGSGATFGLRAWPPETTAERLAVIHGWMREASETGLPFVPALIPTASGRTWAEHGDRLWEVLQWLPGRADFHARPSRLRLEAACAALARLHLAWEPWRRKETGPCPAVRRRLQQQGEWDQWLRCAGPAAHRTERDDPASPIVDRACRVLPRWIGRLSAWLAAWAECCEPVQPCLCDPWHDHLLFEDDRLTGIVDYGAAKVDHPAVDVARLLGSLIEDDEDGWRVGLDAYRRVRPLDDHEAKLAWTLDRTGTIVGVANWIRWLLGEQRRLSDREAAARRLATLVARLERWA